MKTITVTNQVWQRLISIKIKNNKKSIDNVISELLEIVNANETNNA
jgi:predicted CopG family antitoxin